MIYKEDMFQALHLFEMENGLEPEFAYCNRDTMGRLVFALQGYLQRQEWSMRDPFMAPKYRIFNTEIAVDESLPPGRVRLESREMRYISGPQTASATDRNSRTWYGGIRQIYYYRVDKIKSEFDLYELRNCKFLNPISSDALNELLFGTEGGTHDKAND